MESPKCLETRYSPQPDGLTELAPLWPSTREPTPDVETAHKAASGAVGLTERKLVGNAGFSPAVLVRLLYPALISPLLPACRRMPKLLRCAESHAAFAASRATRRRRAARMSSSQRGGVMMGKRFMLGKVDPSVECTLEKTRCAPVPSSPSRVRLPVIRTHHALSTARIPS